MNVFTRLRFHIVSTIVAVLLTVLASLMFVLNYSVYRHITDDAFEFLEQIAQKDGRIDFFDEKFLTVSLSEKRHERGYYLSYGAVVVSRDEKLVELIENFSIELSERDMTSLIKNILAKNQVRGTTDGYLFLIKQRRDSSRLICMLDRSAEDSTMKEFRMFSAIVFALGIIIALIVSYFLSSLFMKPVMKAFEKQKQFVSDSSHELRTPISVISANLSVVMSQIPDNKWLGYIKDENERMGRLVKDLLYLSRSDSDRLVYQFSELNLTQVLNNVILPFESVAFEQNKKLEIQISPNMEGEADEASIKQLVAILLDNAIKYVNENGTVKIRAWSEKDKNYLSVYNTGSGIKKENLENIFERFFREDSSRNRKTGGYGLGLSIAKTISQFHHGTLTCSSDGKSWTEFLLVIPVRQK